MRIVRAVPGQEALLGGFAHRLWPHDTEEKLAALYAGELTDPEKAFFLVKDGATPVGFASCCWHVRIGRGNWDAGRLPVTVSLTMRRASSFISMPDSQRKTALSALSKNCKYVK